MGMTPHFERTDAAYAVGEREVVSTIEEAREQAREALPGALARLVENRLGKSLAREADKDMIALRAAANAIVALLDATEPQETTTPAAKSQLEAVTNAIEKVLDGQGALHCTRVWEAWGYGTMSEEDFSPVADDAEAVHEIASAVLEALGPRPITDEMVDAGAKALNNVGWTYEGADEPGCWCEDCQALCMPPARAILEAAEEARR